MGGGGGPRKVPKRCHVLFEWHQIKNITIELEKGVTQTDFNFSSIDLKMLILLLDIIFIDFRTAKGNIKSSANVKISRLRDLSV